MITETQAEAPVAQEKTATEAAPEKDLSLRETLEAATEISEKGTEKPEDLSEAARRLAGARRPKDAPKDAPKDPALKDAKVEAKPDAKPEEAMEAPAHWPAADREMFAKQPPEAQKWLLGRHKAMEADYTKKTQELTSVRRMKEVLDEVFAPFREQMHLNGIDEVTAIRQLVGAHQFLQRDPAGGIKHLADKYGIELKSLIDGAAAADPAGESPTVKALRTQVEQLTGQLKQFTGAQTEQQMHARLNEVTQFAEEKDDQGNLKRPHFDDVAKDVARLIKAAKSDGETLSLQDAYDQAVYANPQTRQKVLAAQDAQRRAKEEAERKAKADAAKKAAFDVKGEGAAAAVAANNNSLRADLEAAFGAAEGRV